MALININTSPFTTGVLVTGISLANMSSGIQVVMVNHNLGKAATGCAIWNATKEVYGPWALTNIDNNNSYITVKIHGPIFAGSAAGTMDVWFG